MSVCGILDDKGDIQRKGRRGNDATWTQQDIRQRNTKWLFTHCSCFQKLKLIPVRSNLSPASVIGDKWQAIGCVTKQRFQIALTACYPSQWPHDKVNYTQVLVGYRQNKMHALEFPCLHTAPITNQTKTQSPATVTLPYRFSKICLSAWCLSPSSFLYI